MRVGLVMVVKNEAHCIRRCLESVKPLIHHFTVVIDTSTSDDSERVVEEAMMGLPGRCHTRQWLGHTKSRNAANDLARAHSNYLLSIDADDYLVMGSGYQLPQLTADGYIIDIHDGIYGSETIYPRIVLFKSDSRIRYEGVGHDYIVGCQSAERLEGIYLQRTVEGSSWKDLLGKHQDHARRFEEALKLNPADTHSTFYGAQSWRDVWEVSKQPSDSIPALRRAVELYHRRTAMEGGDVREVFYSYLMLGKLLQHLNEWPAAKKAYFKAASINPARAAEPRHDLVVMLRKDRYFIEAYDIGKLSLYDPLPSGLNVDTSIYRWRLELEWACAAWWAGYIDEARSAWKHLLTIAPPEEHEALRRNLTY